MSEYVSGEEKAATLFAAMQDAMSKLRSVVHKLFLEPPAPTREPVYRKNYNDFAFDCSLFKFHILECPCVSGRRLQHRFHMVRLSKLLRQPSDETAPGVSELVAAISEFQTVCGMMPEIVMSSLCARVVQEVLQDEVGHHRITSALSFKQIDGVINFAAMPRSTEEEMTFLTKAQED